LKLKREGVGKSEGGGRGLAASGGVRCQKIPNPGEKRRHPTVGKKLWKEKTKKQEPPQNTLFWGKKEAIKKAKRLWKGISCQFWKKKTARGGIKKMETVPSVLEGTDLQLGEGSLKPVGRNGGNRGTSCQTVRCHVLGTHGQMARSSTPDSSDCNTTEGRGKVIPW